MEEYALLAKASYEYSQAGAERVEEELRDHGKEFRVDPVLSDDHTVVLVRPDGSAVVSYRGTHELGDLVPDAQLALGMSGGRVYDARQRFKEARDKYGRVMATGHSLGGHLALDAARYHDGEAVVFNPGSSPLYDAPHAGFCGMGGCHSKPSTIYTTGRDPISLSSFVFDRVTDRVLRVRPKRDGDALSHSLSHFLPTKPLAVPQRSAKPHSSFCHEFPELCPARVVGA